MSNQTNSSEELVSIIIPIYNSEKFLKKSLESAINQTYKNLEIICINDGSNDDSLNILNQYNDKIIIISQKNLGLASAVNSGINKMKGKWLKWLSPDDILYPNSIEILVNESKKLPENTILYSNWEIINEKGTKLRNFHESNFNDLEKFDFIVRLLDGQQININTTLIPKTIFDSGCMFRSLKELVAIDYDFFLRSGIFFGINFHLITQPLIQYRIHKEQHSHKNIKKTLKFLDTLRHELIFKLDKDTQIKYQKALQNYQKNKPINKQILRLGLQFLLKFLPSVLSDKLLIFYLKNIRSSR